MNFDCMLGAASCNHIVQKKRTIAVHANAQQSIAPKVSLRSVAMTKFKGITEQPADSTVRAPLALKQAGLSTTCAYIVL